MRRLGFEKRKRLMILLIKSTHSEIQRMISFLGLNFFKINMKKIHQNVKAINIKG